ncbi:Elf1-like putative transcription elongation factor [Encephalitozoon intestinalis ATCC 50506]|uniref:Transcription elongation factor 1 homolog n=1 Tax=Encephalitozoon intestinalis (strain ATCC 50506) TaxID=876142 RepID=E0S9E6_ENCIT|nr:Elf1-like putative transcription elongation factor [Encephalitozoon intestinalis ATCC 50506]ADM12210.1 Elf1-like putative transcription elongation factor [Encephalitozoon intestinalis ATCC 50506]UTX46017.1 transcription elongation factor 1 [Encephalitozoon intestinalis]
MSRKRVKRKINAPKRQSKLEKRFNCPVCNHENVVQCTVKRPLMKGFANCSVCDASFTCEANKLTTGIDVYSAWVDECCKNTMS